MPELKTELLKAGQTTRPNCHGDMIFDSEVVGTFFSDGVNILGV